MKIKEIITNTKLPILSGYCLWLLFTIFGLLQRNGEFLIYSSTIIVLMIIIHKTDSIFNFSKLGLWGFNAWLGLHIIGGFASIGGTRMYDFVLLNIIGDPYNIFKYDQFVHIFCYVVMGLLMHDVVVKYAKKNASKLAISVIAILAATGIGGLNEIIEFSAVVFMESNGVGGYFNTALDLVANLLGAIISSVYWIKK